MRITFTRHGESQANLLQVISNRGLQHPLTLIARRQAASLAERLLDEQVTRIYSSPLLRAIETTVILAERLGVEYEVTDALVALVSRKSNICDPSLMSGAKERVL